MKIAVLGSLNIPDKAKEEIASLSETPVNFPETKAESEQELIERTADADAVITSWGTRITKSYLDACPNLKYIGVCATTLGDMDIDAIKERGITLTNVKDYGDEATAEFIFTQLLMLLRGEGKYQWRDEVCELNGKTIGIVGLGAVGQRVARLALGFNMKVLYYSKTRKQEWEDKGLEYTSLNDLLAASDIITVHVPRDTKVLKNDEFAVIRNGSILVETSIGSIMDEAAFKNWVGHGQNFAIFDYSAGESYYQAFKDLPNVIFPKVIAGMTVESRQRLGDKVVENLRDYLQT